MAAAAGALCSLGACVERDYGYRYRLTINVSDGGALFTGSGVVQVTEAFQQSIEGDFVDARKVGEAILVQLRGARALLALFEAVSDPPGLSSSGRPYWRSDPTSLLEAGYGLPFGHDFHSPTPSAAALRAKRGRIALSMDELPQMLFLSNALDPETATRVDPLHPKVSFDPGTRIESAFVEITDAPVTRGLQARLPWLSSVQTDDHLPGTGPARLRRENLVRGL